MREQSKCNDDATRGRDAVDRLVDGLSAHDRVVLVVAHPDDETIGCGAHLRNWARAITIVHVTDGAPPEDSDARAAGCASGAEYAELRRGELEQALALASVGPDRLVCLRVGDQRAVWEVAAIASRLVEILIDREATIVVTQPYEGGHPDHDATALATRLAVDALAATERPTPAPVECTAYHAGVGGALETGNFLPSSVYARAVTLSPDATERRRQMLDCFASQRQTLAPFGCERESFRAAPPYDFARPPHSGRLHYEQFSWGVRDGEEWRRIAALQRTALLGSCRGRGE